MFDIAENFQEDYENNNNLKDTNKEEIKQGSSASKGYPFLRRQSSLRLNTVSTKCDSQNGQPIRGFR